MTDNRVLSDEQIEKEWSITPCIDTPNGGVHLGRAIEQAVLQSPQVQQWRKDAERYQYAKTESSAGKVDICITRKNWHESDHVILCGDSADIEIDTAMEKKP